MPGFAQLFKFDSTQLREPAGSFKGGRFARGGATKGPLPTMEEDMAAQQDFLNARAKEHGFADLDQFHSAKPRLATAYMDYWRHTHTFKVEDGFAELFKFDANQPREPAGSDKGGQFARSAAPPTGKREDLYQQMLDKQGIQGKGYDQIVKELGEDKTLEVFQGVRNEQQRWDDQMQRALSLGNISDADAIKQGYYMESNAHGGKTIELPGELYHVTTAADSVLANGLKTRNELGRDSAKGLGGGTSDTISFTTDRKIADAIHSAMLLMNDVLNDRVKLSDLVEQARQGTDAKRPYLGFIKEVTGGATGKSGLPVELEAAIEGRHAEWISAMNKLWPAKTSVGTDPDEVARRMGSEWKHVGNGVYSRPATVEEQDEAKMRFTKYFLAARENSGGPLDPLFFLTNVAGLKAVPRDQIQTIQAEPRPGARGYQVSSLGEIRVWTGDTIKSTKVIKQDMQKAETMTHTAEVPQLIAPLTIKKTDGRGEQRLVFAEVYAPNRPDSGGDFMTAESIQKMAHSFMQHMRLNKVDTMHNNTEGEPHIVESFIAREDDPVFIPGSWVVGIHIPDDETWAKVKKGELNGLSMEALVFTEEKEMEIDIPPVISGVTSKHEDGHTHKFYVSYDETGNFKGGQTDEVNGHSHVIKAGTFTDKANDHTHTFSAVDHIVIVGS